MVRYADGPDRRRDWRGPSRRTYLWPMSQPNPLVPAVMVVHGALGSASTMAPLTDALQEQRRYARVRCVELPGHGKTPLSDGSNFAMRAFAHALHDAIRNEGLPRPVVFGYSMGGYVALLLEALHPGTFGGIVTLGTMLHWDSSVATRAASRLDAGVMRQKVPDFVNMLDERHAAVGGAEAVLGNTASMLLSLGTAAPLTAAMLGSIQCPVHLLVGDRDDSVTLEDATAVAARMPRAQAVMLPDTPHPIERVSLPLLVQAIADLATATRRES